MADRPLIMSAPMVRALLAGNKTMTRRILKPAPRLDHFASEQLEDFELRGFEAVEQPDGRHLVYRPAWRSGDRLWVREGWQAPAMDDHLSPRDMPPGLARRYLADGAEVVGVGADTVRQPIGAAGRSRPSIHMPRWASRLTLTVTEVRVQRLAEITDGDAIDEGALRIELSAQGPSTERGKPPLGASPRQRFAHLWDSLHGKGAFDASPRVAALTFTTTPANIDSLPEQP